MMARPTILVAEDDRVMAGVIRFNLARAGFDVFVCHDGAAAMQALRTMTFDLVLTDFQMPYASGEDICRFIRTELQDDHTPVVLVSAKGMEVLEATVVTEVGFNGIIYKPFSPTEVIRTARSFLTTVAETA